MVLKKGDGSSYSVCLLILPCTHDLLGRVMLSSRPASEGTYPMLRSKEPDLETTNIERAEMVRFGA
jgi:hypothetical protein